MGSFCASKIQFRQSCFHVRQLWNDSAIKNEFHQVQMHKTYALIILNFNISFSIKMNTVLTFSFFCQKAKLS